MTFLCVKLIEALQFVCLVNNLSGRVISETERVKGSKHETRTIKRFLATMKPYVKCNCEHCTGHIEFDPKELSAENSLIACPHCGLTTRLSLPNASNYQKTILHNLGILDDAFLTGLDESQAEQTIESARRIEEHLFELRRDGFIRVRVSKEIYSNLLRLNSSDFPTATSLLDHIKTNLPNILLSKTYGKAKAHEQDERQKSMQEGNYAPVITISDVPERQLDEPDSTPAQKRFLRDLGVRDEQALASLGKFAASELIEKLLEGR